MAAPNLGVIPRLASTTTTTASEKLSQEIGRIVMLPENQERIARDGATARSSTPAEFEKLVHTEIATRTKIFKAAGVKPG